MQLFLGALLSLAAVLGAERLADAAPVEAKGAIRVTPGVTCLDETELDRQVQTWLGHDRFPANVHVAVVGDAENPRIVSFKILRDGKVRERRFEPTPAKCDEMHAVVALAIALAVDADLFKKIADLAAPRPPTRSWVVLQAAAAYEAAPGYSLGGQAGIEYRFTDWLSGIGDALAQHSWNNAVSGSAGTFTATVVAGGLGVCTGGNAVPEVRFELCLSAAAGILQVDGSGYTVSHSATGLWVAALSGLRMTFQGALPWVVDLDVVSPLSVPSVRVEERGGPDRFRDPNPIGVLLSVGPALAL